MNFRIETPRLFLRPWETADRPVFECFVADTEMMRFISRGRVWNQSGIDAYFNRQARNLACYECCVGAAVSREDNTIIGMGGIQPLERAGVFELAWWIWRDYWNRGLATEMAQACRDYAFKTLKLPEVLAIIDPANLASIRVAEKLGMRNEGTRNAHELAERCPSFEVLCFRLTNTRYRPARGRKNPVRGAFGIQRRRRRS